MKRKIFLILALAAMLVCALAVCANADTVVSSASDEFGELTTFDEAIGNTSISQNKNDGTVARAVLKTTDDEGNVIYYTVPSTYILTKSTMSRNGVSGEMLKMNFNAIKEKLGKSFDKHSVVRFEFPAGVLFINNNNDESFNGCANLKEVIVSQGLRIWDNSQRKVFTNCDSLVTVDISGMILDGTVNTYSMFEYCDNLEKVILPDAYFNGTAYLDYETDHMFNGCKKLTTIENMEGLFKGVKSLGFKTFYDCYVLKEITLWNGLEALEGRSIGNCRAITSLIIPETVTRIVGTTNHWCVVENCTSLKKVVFPSGAVEVGDYAFEKCSGLTDVWMPGKGTTFGKQVFGQCGSGLKVNFYFQNGSDVITITNTVNNNDPFITALNTANDARIKTNTPLSVKCEVFLGGHTMGSEAVIKNVDYTKDIQFVVTCTACQAEQVDESKTMAAVFTYYGYSCTEEAIGGVYSMSQFYGVNRDALGAYTAYTGKSFAYGLVASGVANPFEYKEGELTLADKAVVKESETFAHDFFGIKINGMLEGNLETSIVFCAYVIDDGKVFYLDNDTTVSEIKGICYNDVLAILNSADKEEE